MIITEVIAENFRKYERLHLKDLPQLGLILVTGRNESGKSSIGEALSFGLFGRTDNLTADRTNKLIHWGAEEASITVSFVHAGNTYHLKRRVSKLGSQQASLLDDQQQVLASTPTAVDQFLTRLVGFNYSTFSRTFYWSQQLGTEREPDITNLHKMAGIKAYAQLDDALQQELQSAQESFDKLEADHKATQAAQAAISVDTQRLPDLLEVREVLEDRQKQSQALVSAIPTGSEQYLAGHASYQRYRRKSRWLGRWSMLGMISLLLVLAAWAILTLVPQWLDGIHRPDFTHEPFFARLLLWVGVGIAIITSFVLFRGWYVERYRLQPLREQANQFSHILQTGWEQANTSIDAMLGGKSTQYLQERHLFSQVPEVGKLASDLSLSADMPKQVREYAALPDQVRYTGNTISEDLKQRGRFFGQCMTSLDEDVSKERSLVDQFMSLNREAAEQTAQMTAYQQELKVKAKASELLRQSSQFSIARFNQIVQQRCQGLLSDFTHSHYNSLEINNDFALRVLSDEKGDYLDFDEISSGTQRQISLAMRMALGNSLVESNDTESQFIFLDEPFAFFDAERTSAALQSLQEATLGHLKQAWVTMQEVPEGVAVAKTIHCLQNEPVLEV
ncbi:AAA family ATPase [uncultured Thiothrix sp.]|uniref:ATP-binding protein n=1 Tax=uncultured Thiothrix sp. TaxID=223185 RepID=UPI00260D7D2A|nr:AAA family ATPase [uncultured Thiothrix sp.]